MAGFKEFHDLDSSTTFCPCGASIERSDARYCDPTVFVAWKAAHAAHVDTDKATHHITDDGMRVCSDGTKRTWVDDPYDAREAPDPEAARRWYTETLPVLAAGAGDRIGVSLGKFRAGDALAAGLDPAKIPCQMMLGDGPGSLTERPCGATPTVGGNGLYRYCERHMRMAAKAGATTLQRDADGTVMLSTTGTVSGTFAPGPVARKVIRCDNTRTVLTPTGKFDDSGDLVATTLASIDRMLAEEPPGTVHKRSGCQSGFIADPHGLLRCTGCCAVAGNLTDAEQVAWMRVRGRAVRVYHNGSFSVGADPSDHVVNDEDRALAAVAEFKMSSSVEARGMRRGPPIGKAPQCGHQTITDGCSVCAILRRQLARVGDERAARIAMYEADALGPADADELRRQFGLTEATPRDPVGIRVSDMVPGLSPGALRVASVPSNVPPLRPDGFSQAQVDAAKAVLLAPVVKRGGR